MTPADIVVENLLGLSMPKIFPTKPKTLLTTKIEVTEYIYCVHFQNKDIKYLIVKISLISPETQAKVLYNVTVRL